MNVPVERLREQIVTLLTAWGMDPELARITAEVMIDADAGLGHPAAVMAMGIAIKKAKAMGVGVASVFNSHHFGAAGYYAAMASKEGLVGIDRKSVV